MPSYYFVYSPFSGYQKAQDCYCCDCNDQDDCAAPFNSPCESGGLCTACGNDNCLHPKAIEGMCTKCSVDISGYSTQVVKSYLSAAIKSIKTYRTGPNDDGDGLCGTPPPAGYEWVNEGVKVELYKQTGGSGYIGTIVYGHLSYRIANGTYNSPNGLTVGYLGPSNCNCDCYRGIHIHMERNSVNGGYTFHRLCGTSVGTTTGIYRFQI